MNAEGDGPSLGGARLDELVSELERMLAELDALGLSRIALPINEAIEQARSTRACASDRPARRSNTF